MGKLVAWLILIFVVLLALRVITARNRRAQSDRTSGAGAPPKIEPMVRCTRCGIYLPRNEAVEVGGGVVCADQNCLKR